MFEWECDRVLSVIELKKQIETLFHNVNDMLTFDLEMTVT